MKRFVSLSTALLACLPAAFGASNNRSYVASYGSNLNPCTRVKPCADFAFALTQTATGGEIDALDSADYPGFTITVPVTIDGGPGNIVSLTATPVVCNGQSTMICVDPFAIVVPLTNSAVTLRNLTINPAFNFSANNGITVSGNSSVRGQARGYVQIENVQVTNASFAIDVTAGTVSIQDSNLRNCGVGVEIDGGVVALENVAVRDCGTGVGNNAVASTISIRNSNLNQNFVGVDIETAALVHIDTSSMSHCFGPACMGVKAAAGSTVQLSNVTVTGNSIGLLTSGGSIISFANNRIYNNATNGAPSQTVYQK